MKNADRPIQPLAYDVFIEKTGDFQKTSSVGLTKREYFAAKAMQAFASNPDWSKSLPNDWDIYIDKIASASVQLANETLDALEAYEKTNK